MHKYYVSSNQRLTSSTLLLTLTKDPDDTRQISFQPGQYAAISTKMHGRPTAARCFSIVSSPTEQDMLQFSMRTRGHFTHALTNLKEGDEVKVRGPFGGFVFDAERDKNTVMLIGGIGITPIISMLRFATYTNLANKFSLIYSCQTQDDVPFAKQLIKLEEQNHNLRVMFVFGEGPTDKFASQKVEIGRVDPEILDHVTAGKYDEKTFFICGPPPFMKGMTKILRAKGAPKRNIITEAFGQGHSRQTGKIRSWPTNMYIITAAGILFGSFIIMIGDLLKTLPLSSIFDTTNINRLETLKNSRQVDLDNLVNGLPEVTNDAPATHAVNKAIQEYNDTLNTKSGSTSRQQTITPKSTTTTKPKPVPKCTTTQSGVTTCV